MPYAPRRGCGSGSYKELAVPGSQYCEEHKKLVDRQYSRYTRDSEIGKKYGRAWKRIRSRYVKEHPLCEKCLTEERLAPAKEVHHILPVSKGGRMTEAI